MLRTPDSKYEAVLSSGALPTFLHSAGPAETHRERDKEQSGLPLEMQIPKVQHDAGKESPSAHSSGELPEVPEQPERSIPAWTRKEDNRYCNNGTESESKNPRPEDVALP